MKKLLVRTAMTALAVGPALTIGLARPAAADAPCVVVVVCPPADPAPTQPAVPSPEPEPQPAPQPAPPPSQPEHRSPAAVTGDLLTMLNRERADRGLPLFTRRADVDDVAARWSDHLAESGALSHNDAYFTPESRAQHGGRALGENVALDAEAQPAHQHLMASPHHRDNILDTRFTVVGLGATFRDGSWWITEDFLQPAVAGTSAARPIAAPATTRAVPPAPAAPTASPSNPTDPAEQAAPVAEVEAVTLVAPSPHWLESAPGRSTETVRATPLSSSHGAVPAPAAGLAVAGLCGVTGIFFRRRAVALATS